MDEENKKDNSKSNKNGLWLNLAFAGVAGVITFLSTSIHYNGKLFDSMNETNEVLAENNTLLRRVSYLEDEKDELFEAMLEDAKQKGELRGNIFNLKNENTDLIAENNHLSSSLIEAYTDFSDCRSQLVESYIEKIANLDSMNGLEREITSLRKELISSKDELTNALRFDGWPSLILPEEFFPYSGEMPVNQRQDLYSKFLIESHNLESIALDSRKLFYGDAIDSIDKPTLVQAYLNTFNAGKEECGEAFADVHYKDSIDCLNAAIASAALLHDDGYPPYFMVMGASQDSLDHINFLYKDSISGKVGFLDVNGGSPAIYDSFEEVVSHYKHISNGQFNYAQIMRLNDFEFIHSDKNIDQFSKRLIEVEKR